MALADARISPAIARRIARPVLGLWLRPWMPVKLSRRWMDLLGRGMPAPKDTTVGWRELGDIRTMAVAHAEADPATAILYLHGGGYWNNSPSTYRVLAAHLSEAARAPVLVPAYRRAPEQPCPAAIEDAVAAYRALIAEPGQDPSRTVIVGDSAGGGLAVAAAVALRDAGEELPAALGLICPWVDLTCSGNSFRSNAKREPAISKAGSRRAADMYRGGLPADDPRVSPLNAELRGLPPTVMQLGGDDILLSEGEELGRRLEAAGVALDSQTFAGLWHVFHGFAGLMREADAALAALGGKLRMALTGAQPRPSDRAANAASQPGRAGEAFPG